MLRINICEFAEKMEQNGNSYEPVQEKGMGKEQPGKAR